jgi:nitrite reductase (NADH) small subunit
LDNYDPVAKNFTLSRGMCGDKEGELMFAAPTYKEHYSLITGQCLDDANLSVPVYDAKIENGEVWVKV